MIESRNRSASLLGVMIAGGVALAAPMSRSGTANAATITVNGSCSLSQAISAVNNRRATGSCAAGTGGDTIVIASAATTSLSNTLTITRSVTIRSSIAKNQTQIQTAVGTSPSAMFTISPLAGTSASVVFQDINMFDPNGNTSAIRATGRNSGDKLTLTRCLVTGFGTSGVFASEMSVAVSDSYFLLNNAQFGAGIRLEGNGNNTVLTLANSSFELNSAANSGGAIYDTAHAHSTISNCTFNKNSADTGGALALVGPGGTFDIVGSTIANNTASTQGGGGSSSATINFTLTLLAANYIGVIAGNSDLSSDWDFNSTINSLNDSLLASSFRAGRHEVLKIC